MTFNLKFLKYLYNFGVILAAVPPINFKTLKLKKSTLRITWSIFMCINYIALYFISIQKRFKDSYPFTPNITDTILDFGSYTCMTITAIMFIINNCLLYHKKLQKLFKKFSKIDKLLITNNNSNKFNNNHCKWFIKHVLILGFILVFNVFYTEIFWTVTITFESNSSYTAANLLKIQLFIMSMIIYNLALALKHRFCFLNKNLKAIDIKIFLVKDIYKIIPDNDVKLNFFKLNYIHKELLLMCVDFNRIFGNPILFLSITFIVSILHPINSALCQVMKGNVFDGVDIPNFGLHYVIIAVLSAFNCIVRISFYSFVFIYKMLIYLMILICFRC